MSLQPAYNDLWLEPYDVRSLTGRFHCTNARSLDSTASTDYVEVDIEPPLPALWSSLDGRPAHVSAQLWPLLIQDQRRVILSPRHAGVRLLPTLSEARVHVHVYVRAGTAPQVEEGELARPLWGIVSLPPMP